MQDKLIIFDTTLRDGEQSAGVNFSQDEKITIASNLDQMGVDVIEVGFAASSDGELQAIKAICPLIYSATLCSLARAVDNDIRKAGEALHKARRSRIHTFISTSDIHLQHQLNKTYSQVLQDIKHSVSLATELADEVEWSGMDATRSNLDFLCEAIEQAIACGATVINIPDTVGYTVPSEYRQLISNIRKKVSNIDKAIISVHCHNDLGLAVANSLESLLVGARQIECTINGLGERAGNTAMEEVVMAVKTRKDVFQCTSGIDTTQFNRISKMVATMSGFVVQRNKAIVGQNAFLHESGIHQDGVLKNSQTYEIMTPESVGATSVGLTMGKLSGRAAFADKLKKLGYHLDEERFRTVFAEFKKLATHKKHLYDQDIISLLADGALQIPRYVILRGLSLQYSIIEDAQVNARLSLEIDGKLSEIDKTGTGSIEVVFDIIKNSVGLEVSLHNYQVNAATKGIDSYADVIITVSYKGDLYSGRASNQDTVFASACAYIDALNNIIYETRNPDDKIKDFANI